MNGLNGEMDVEQGEQVRESISDLSHPNDGLGHVTTVARLGAGVIIETLVDYLLKRSSPIIHITFPRRWFLFLTLLQFIHLGRHFHARCFLKRSIGVDVDGESRHTYKIFCFSPSSHFTSRPLVRLSYTLRTVTHPQKMPSLHLDLPLRL